jgi:hypothetical protein
MSPELFFIRGCLESSDVEGSLVVLEVPFPNDDQRNMQESLSKAKRKVLLAQKGAATDHSLLGRTH